VELGGIQVLIVTLLVRCFWLLVTTIQGPARKKTTEKKHPGTRFFVNHFDLEILCLKADLRYPLVTDIDCQTSSSFHRYVLFYQGNSDYFG
jgi:hypothetical protein